MASATASVEYRTSGGVILHVTRRLTGDSRPRSRVVHKHGEVGSACASDC